MRFLFFGWMVLSAINVYAVQYSIVQKSIGQAGILTSQTFSLGGQLKTEASELLKDQGIIEGQIILKLSGSQDYKPSQIRFNQNVMGNLSYNEHSKSYDIFLRAFAASLSEVDLAGTIVKASGARSRGESYIQLMGFCVDASVNTLQCHLGRYGTGLDSFDELGDQIVNPLSRFYGINGDGSLDHFTQIELVRLKSPSF